MSEYSDKARAEFFSEAQEIIDGMSRDFLLLDAAVQDGREEPAVLNAVFRGVHTLKGLCGMFGEAQMSGLSHELESLLDSLRMGRLNLTVDILDQLFQGMELLTQLLAQSHDQGNNSDNDKVEAFLRNVQKTIQVGRQQQDEGISYRLDPSMLAVLTEYEEHRLRSALKNGLRLYQVHVVFDLTNLDGGLDTLRQAVAPHGEILTYLPTAASEDADGISLDVLVASSTDTNTLQAALGDSVSSIRELPRVHSSVATGPSAAATVPPSSHRLPGNLPIIVTPSPPQPATDLPPALDEQRRQTSWPPPSVHDHTEVPQVVQHTPIQNAVRATSLRSISQTVRVDIRRLDRLMNQVGELRLVSSDLEKLVVTAREAADTDMYRSLRQVHHLLERKLKVLQDGILDVRMVPLAQVFEKLERVARQAGRETGKQANLVITGAETEVDKLIGEDLGDPLMHMIRNAMAHGIEKQDVRREVGKPLKGTVAVNAYHQGSQVVVEIEDDGAGIDQQNLVNAAVRQNLITKEEAAELNDQDKLALLFLPGISTAKPGGNLSGRGVGMDVVKTNIGKLGGVVDVQSQLGIGTKFTITLPITLAMISALLLRARSSVFAVPLANIEEVLPFEVSDVEQIEGHDVLPNHGVSLPLCRLAETFQLEDVADEPPSESSPKDRRVIVVSAASRRMGLVVDEIQGTRDIVIKPLTGGLRSWPGFAGATELGNKQLGLVLDVPRLLEESLGSLVAVRNN